MAIQIGGNYNSPTSEPGRIITQDRVGKMELTPSQMTKVEDLILRVLDLTSEGKISWRTSLIGTSNFFFEYKPEPNTCLAIHRFISSIRNDDVQYSIEIILDKNKLGTFKGRPIDDLGNMCHLIFGKAKIRDTNAAHDKVISQLDKMASLAGVNKTKASRLIDSARYSKDKPLLNREHIKLAEEYTEPAIEKDAESDKSAFYDDHQSYDKEPKKSSGKLGKLLKAINPLSPILDGMRDIITKK